MADITLNIGGNTRQAEKDIQKLVNRTYNINLKTKGEQPLGRITGKVNEFTKSLDASNARVIAFGASAGIIFGVERAFSALVSATIEVQKSLQDINVILNVSTSELQKFGGQLFNIAKNTGQSFQEVAKAATEFSRQGLGIEETLKRTNEALILSRLSGLDAAKSVEALTAAVNSYASQAVTATEVVNKFANVDAAFAVSSADLAEALSRVGSSAAQSGVSLNELIAIVTSAQQTTARGGAVIGNSFKTIFTRLQRGKVVSLLESLGISSTDASGQVKSTIQLLQDLGKVYDTLGSQQQAYIAEQVGGVFQINILKSALADLGKEYSIYNNALNVAANTTDQAIRRNEELNKTYAAQINVLTENARQLAAAGGERLLGPTIDRLVGGSNLLLGGINESDGQSFGAVLGKGILDGLGQFIAGPGLALIGGVLLKLFRDLTKFAAGSVQQLLGLNTAAVQQRDLQESINQILAKNPKLLEMALKSEQGLNTAANTLLANLQKQTVELQKQATVAAQISKAFISQAGVRISGGVPVAPPIKPGKAAGYIPNFTEEAQARDLGAKPNVKAVLGVGKIGGKRFQANNQEFQFKNFAGTGETAVIPKYGNGIKEAAKMIARGESGSILDKSDRNKAKGFVPNFVDNKNIYKSQKKFAAGKVFDNAIALSLKLKSAYLEDKDIIDFPPNQLSASIVDKQIKDQLGINRQTLYGDAKLSASKSNQASYISKILRLGGQLSGDPKRGYTVNPIGSGGSILIPGSNEKKLADKKEDLRAGVGTIIKKNPSLKNYFEQRGIEKGSSIFLPNVLIDYVSGITGKNVFGAVAGRGKNFNDPNTRAFAAQSIASKFKSRASGFIPNFAQAEITNLGDTVTSPLLKGKVSSLIYPAITDGLSKKEATATYLGKKYKGLVTTAGINKAEIKSEIPDLEKNLGNLLMREANQFGQAIGGQNFLQSPEELPNYGGVKGAVGVAFEGGVTTLLQRSLQKSSQIAGIDFTQERMNPKMKRLFHGAPGTYEAKYSPDLANDVLAKMLKAANVGGVKDVRSGPNFKANQALRAQALKNLQGQNLRRGPQLEKAIKEEMARLNRASGMAAGFVPNFAAPKFLGNINFKDLPRATGKDLALRRQDINTNENFKRQSIDGQILREYVSIIKKLGRTKQTEKLYRGVKVPEKDFGKLTKQSIFDLRAGRDDRYRGNDFKMFGTPEDEEYYPIGILDALNDQVSQDSETDNDWRMTSTSKNKLVAKAFATPDDFDPEMGSSTKYKGAYSQINFPSKRIVDDKVYKALLKKFPGKQLDIQRVLFRLARTHGGKGIAFDSQMVRKYVDNKAQLKREQDFPIYAGGYIPNFANPKLIEAINRRITNPNISTKLSEGSGLSNDAYIRAATKLGVNTSGLDAFLKQPGFPLKGRAKIQALSRALGEGWLGRSFNVDALKIGDWKYLQKQFEENGLTKNDFDQVAKFARSSRGERALKMGFKSQATKMREMEFLRKPGAAAGHIPNFAAIQDAVARERAAGIPSSQIYLAQEKALKSANPMGLGVFNKRDEPTAAKRREQMRRKGFANGYIPNFAETPESSAASVGTVVSALVSQLGFLAITLQGSRQEYKQSLAELTKSNVTQAKINTANVREQAKAKIDYSSTASFRESRKQAANEIREARKQEKAAARVTGGQKLQAGLKAGGLGLGIAAPILAQTLAQAIPQETKTGRVSATGVGALGNIGAAAATGAVFGPIGAAVGAAAGALLEIPNFVGALSTNFPELQAAVQKSSQELTKFSDAGSQLLTSFESLQAALKNPNTSQDLVNKAADAYAKALSGLSSEDQKRLQEAAEIGKLEDEYAKILSEKTAGLKSRESAAEAARIAGEAETTSNLINIGVSAAKRVPGLGVGVSALEQLGVIDAFAPQTLAFGTKEEKANQQSFIDQVLQGKTGKEALKALETAGGTSFTKDLLQIQPGDTKALEDLLNKTIPEGAGKADFVAAQLQMANNSTTAFANVVASLGTAFTQTIVKTDESIKTSDSLAASQIKEAQAKDAATKATEKIIESLQRNIRVAQITADTNRALAKANAEFQRSTAFADAYTRPTETVGAIVGENAPLAQAFSLRESVAAIGLKQVEGIENIKSELVKTINESLTTAFDDAVKETTGKATGEGLAADIVKSNKEVLSPLADQQEKAFSIVQNVLDKTLVGGGDIQTEALLSDISKSLQDANINGGVIEKITEQVREESRKGNLEITKLRDQSVKEFKTLAKEQTQKILIAKIGQAQKFGGASVGGGIEEFINPKDAGQNVFDKVVESTTGFEQFQGQQADFRFDYLPGSNQFQYQYRQAEEARREMAPERGRKALSLIGQLQDFTGYTPEAGGKGVQAGVAGLTEFFNKQIKELSDIAKTTGDPLVRDEINAALKEVNKLGGVENIARLQVAQRTGSLNDLQFKEIAGKFQNPVLETLRSQAQAIGKDTPEGQALLRQLDTLSMDMLVSQDPTVKAINITNSILNDILRTFGGERITEATLDSNITSTVKPLPTTIAQQSFTQQETALNNNTSTISNLNTNIQNLNSTLSNFEASFTNLNNVPGAQPAAGAQQAGVVGATTTTNAPVNVVVNAQGSNDIAAAVGQAVQNAIPTIIDKVKVALGQKVAPTIKNKQGQDIPRSPNIIL